MKLEVCLKMSKNRLERFTSNNYIEFQNNKQETFGTHNFRYSTIFSFRYFYKI